MAIEQDQDILLRVSVDASHTEVGLLSLHRGHARHISAQHIPQVTCVNGPDHLLSNDRDRHGGLLQGLGLMRGGHQRHLSAPLSAYHVGETLRIVERAAIIGILFQQQAYILCGFLLIVLRQVAEGQQAIGTD